MKAKNFLFTAVLTFGAILFATNVSAQTTPVTTGTVNLNIKLKDFQELKVNGASSIVEFSFESSNDFIKTTETVVTADNQLTVFSTKKFNINVKATDFTGGGKTLTGVIDLGLFKVQATNVNGKPVVGENVVLNSTTTPQNLFTSSQERTKSIDGYNVGINYTLTNPSTLIDKIDELVTKTSIDGTTEDTYTSTVTYTIIPG